jgi:hypothetical protein
MPTWKQETQKTAIFVVLDIVLVFLFTWVWFRFIQKKKQAAFKESLWFTVFMQLFFFMYFFIFDYWWDSRHSV